MTMIASLEPMIRRSRIARLPDDMYSARQLARHQLLRERALARMSKEKIFDAMRNFSE